MHGEMKKCIFSYLYVRTKVHMSESCLAEKERRVVFIHTVLFLR